jgi:hypothetical protein
MNRLLDGQYYKVLNLTDVRIFHIKVLHELPFWDYPTDSYMCLVLTPGDYYGQRLILSLDKWQVMELTKIEKALL